MSPIDPNLRIGAATLGVADLPRSIDFYERVLGLPLQSTDTHRAALGPDPGAPTLLLEQISSPSPIPPHSTGLYHVAWLHPSRAALAASVQRIVGSGWRFDGASDHGVSEALYLSDPDGLGVEIYADRPRERWPRSADGDSIEMVTLPLDLSDLLAQAQSAPQLRVAPGTTIGHVHMKTTDVPAAAAFYRDALGMNEQAQLPSASFLAAGDYHHHVGLNSWQSRGAPAAPETAPGLRALEFELSTAALAALERGLAEHAAGRGASATAAGTATATGTADGALTVRDPDGQPLTFRGV